ncbi:hypothetical protein ACFQZ4_00150 [Catellatospora coxensis]
MDNTVTPDWTQALAWIDDALAGAGLTAAGPVEQTRVRPWSVLAKVPVGDTVVWFKANGHCSTYEARLLDALGRWAPGRVLEPIAIDGERGWSLLPDGDGRCARSPPTTRRTGRTCWPGTPSCNATWHRARAR